MSSTISYKKLAKLFGLQKDREGLILRYLNERDNWESHLQNTKSFILRSAKNKQKGTAVILGSGWWLDIPYEELAEMFNKLILVDISHPNQIKHKAKKYNNIELITADISGTLKSIYEIKRGGNTILAPDDFIVETNNFGFGKKNEADFVVSLNILNQLSFFAKKYLIGNDIFSENEANIIAEMIEQKHIESLPKNKSCLIVDYLQFDYDNDNNLLSESNRLKIDLPKDKIKKEWIWDFDMLGNFIKNRIVKFKVAALQV